MRYPKIVTLLCFLIAASYVVPWASGPLGRDMTPYRLMSDLGLRRIADAPPEITLFVATFALAAFTGIVALFWSAPRLLAMATGALPFGIVAWIATRARAEIEKTGLPMPDWRNLGRLLDGVDPAGNPGLFLYFGSALGLLLLAILVPGRR